MDYKDPFFTERGVDPDVAAVRGYTMWDGDNFQEVVADTFGDLPRPIQGWANYVMRQEPDTEGLAFWGITIPRMSPPGYLPIPPGLRPSDPVKLGPPQRHIHRDEELTKLTDVLPAHVEEAYAALQRGRVKIHFKHSHGRTEEFADHIAQFHGIVPADSHGHTYYVYNARDMRKHINNDGKGSHNGDKIQIVHAHQRRAKYLYPPSNKAEVTWDSSHIHKEMSPEQYKRHIQFFHSEEE